MDIGVFLCPKENESDGCVNISCTCFHMHPRYINGLFLPSNSNVIDNHVYHKREEICKDFKYLAFSQGDMWIPIYPPLVVTLNASEDDDESDEVENKNENEDYVEPRVKTTEEIEEEKALSNICWQAGQYFQVNNSYETPLPNFMDRRDQMHVKASKDPQEDGDFTLLKGYISDKDLSMYLTNEKQHNGGL
ncbi:hypothetical protein XELAEV_18016895mg [Xenopus laevis]|uniref:Uncharacterized protein n=1 Tax=Xenopus laevis TaxID=8355 RepID=A0A974HS52_XENLA|nr:hypothetical protein XELAEV_18016895mg [Xenopus laevis]